MVNDPLPVGKSVNIRAQNWGSKQCVTYFQDSKKYSFTPPQHTHTHTNTHIHTHTHTHCLLDFAVAEEPLGRVGVESRVVQGPYVVTVRSQVRVPETDRKQMQQPCHYTILKDFKKLSCALDFNPVLTCHVQTRTYPTRCT